MNIVPLFSTPLYINEIDIDKNILSFVREQVFIPCDQYNPAEGLTTGNNYVLELPEFKNLKKNIDTEINYFLKEILKFYTNFKITTSWIIRHKKGHSAKSHFHKNSLFSGVVYLQVSDNSGDIVFTNNEKSLLYPSEITLDVDEYNDFNMLSWTLRPKVNNILIFPSHLTHFVTPNNSIDDRYVLAFNIFPSGIFDKGTVNELKII